MSRSNKHKKKRPREENKPVDGNDKSPSGSGGGGQSRAAKKRAKQKENQKRRALELQQQQQQQQQQQKEGEETKKKDEAKQRGDEVDNSQNISVNNKESKKTGKNKKSIETSNSSKKHKETKDNKRKSEESEAKDTAEARKAQDSEDEKEELTSRPPPTLAQILSNSDFANKEATTDEFDDDDNDTMVETTAEERGRMLLSSILFPQVSVDRFYHKYWEKAPLHISSAHKDRFDGVFSMRNIKQMVSRNGLRYTYDLNVTKCDATTSFRRLNFDSNNNNDSKAHKMKSRNKNNNDDENSDAALPDMVDPAILWPRFHDQHCTVRLLCPQKHHDTLHDLLSLLESEFGCMVGCNAYLTPGPNHNNNNNDNDKNSEGCQGFAPHYDDIKAFILQMEGRKRWRVYRPLEGRETLPRVSSNDFRMVRGKHGQEKGPNDGNGEDDGDDDEGEGLEGRWREIHLATKEQQRQRRRLASASDTRRPIADDPVLDVVLEPGDVLYMPRGWIHQAHTLPLSSVNKDENKDGHSLHLTISCMQQWSWADLLELLLPEALTAAVESDSTTLLREGLPRNFLSYMGTLYADGEDMAVGQANNKDENLSLGKSENGDAHKAESARKDDGEEEENDDDDGDDDDDEEDGDDARKLKMKLALQEAAKRAMIQNREEGRALFKEALKKRINRVYKEALSMVDAACDQMGKRFLSDRQPPSSFSPTSASATDFFTKEEETSFQILPTSMCRLAREGIARLVLEQPQEEQDQDDGNNHNTSSDKNSNSAPSHKAVVYHCMDNSREFHGTPLSPLEFELDDAPSLELLLKTHPPFWIRVADLIHEDMEDKVGIAQALFDEGILAVMR